MELFPPAPSDLGMPVRETELMQMLRTAEL